MEEHRLRVFENGVLKNMIGPKMEEVIRVLIKLRIEELNDLYFSLDIVRVATGGGGNGLVMWQVWGEIYTLIWCGQM
jgi:hypothetical protein